MALGRTPQVRFHVWDCKANKMALQYATAEQVKELIPLQTDPYKMATQRTVYHKMYKVIVAEGTKPPKNDNFVRKFEFIEEWNKATKPFKPVMIPASESRVWDSMNELYGGYIR